MTRKAALLLVSLCAAVLGACATLPGAESVSAVRPQSELPAATPAHSGAKVHVDLGLAYLDIGRYDVALDEARAALRLVADYAPAFHLMGLVYMYLEDPTAARDNFERALQIGPDDPEVNNSYGWFLCTRGQFAEGLDRLSRAARNPYYRTPTRPYTNAGLCLLRKQDAAAAETFFLRAVQADPSNIQALFQLASIAYRRGEFEAARSHLIRLHQQSEPTAESVWLGLRTERRLGNGNAEASYAAQLRNRFSGSPEHQAMQRGQYE